MNQSKNAVKAICGFYVSDIETCIYSIWTVPPTGPAGLPTDNILTPLKYILYKIMVKNNELQNIQTEIQTDISGTNNTSMQLCSHAEKQHSSWHFACQSCPKTEDHF